MEEHITTSTIFPSFDQLFGAASVVQASASAVTHQRTEGVLQRKTQDTMFSKVGGTVVITCSPQWEMGIYGSNVLLASWFNGEEYYDQRYQEILALPKVLHLSMHWQNYTISASMKQIITREFHTCFTKIAIIRWISALDMLD